MILFRWWRQRIIPIDVLKKTPWHILVFAFSMYIIVFGLHNVGFTSVIIDTFRAPVSKDHYNAVLIWGLLLTGMSNLLNNLPAVMLGTLAITKMGLDSQTMQVSYLANILGSDIGALIMPMGTLATLIWMFILRQNKINISWRHYLGITTLTVPIGLIVSLLSLYFWSRLLI